MMSPTKLLYKNKTIHYSNIPDGHVLNNLYNYCTYHTPSRIPPYYKLEYLEMIFY